MKFDEPDFIRRYFNGDKAAYNNFRKYRVRKTLYWDDILLQSKCAPEFRNQALSQIRHWLGYIPAEHIYMRHISYLQSLVAGYKSGTILFETFSEQLYTHLLNIRNDDMKKGGWVRFTTRHPADIKRYETYLSVFRQPARQRLSALLGYEPSLDYSLEAEVYMRQLFANDSFHTNMDYTEADYKAATITTYRQTFIQFGEAEADRLSFVTQML